MRKYFVIDKQGTHWKEEILWNSVKEIADSIRDYDDYDDETHGKLTDSALIELWDFEYHRFTPANCIKYGVKPSDFGMQEVDLYA